MASTFSLATSFFLYGAPDGWNGGDFDLVAAPRSDMISGIS
jgi:hypothetical protein